MSSTPEVLPRYSKTTLEPLLNMHIVENQGYYEYYPVVLNRLNPKFVRIARSSPILKDGYISFEKNIYKVTIADIIKGKLNVEHPIPRSSISTNTRPISSDVATSDQTGLERRSTRSLEFQVDKDADLAWQEQTLELLHLEDPEAQWELVEDASQPQQFNESGAV